MRFSASVVLSGLLAANALAIPTTLKKRGVLTKQTYARFQISDGVAGNAQAEVLQKFPVRLLKLIKKKNHDFITILTSLQINMNDLANVAPEDQKIISDARKVAESAETDAFNPAIEAASGAAATALQNGKIKNKVLKLQLEVMDLMISQARGSDNAAKITEEQTKLNNNIATDKKNAGATSQSVAFNG